MVLVVALVFGSLAAGGSTQIGANFTYSGTNTAPTTFTLNGTTYHLPQNNGPNTLHGGPNAFNTQVWDATELRGVLEVLQTSENAIKTVRIRPPAT